MTTRLLREKWDCNGDNPLIVLLELAQEGCSTILAASIPQAYWEDVRYFGILLIFNVVAVAGYLILSTGSDPKRISVVAALGIIAGVLILIADRITTFSNPLLGKFTAATEQAEAGAARVKAIEVQVASQRDTMDGLVRDASRSRDEIGRVEELASGAKEKADELGRLTADASANVAAQKQITDFSLILIRFRNDDRLAFDELIGISRNGHEPFKTLAEQALVSYLNAGSVLGVGLGTNSLRQLPTPFDVNSASMAEYRDAILGNTPEISVTILDASWTQARFSWRERLGLLVDVVQTTKSLRVLLDALMYLEKEARLGVGARDWPAYVEWWRQNQSQPKYSKSAGTDAKSGP
jgi:hypothetical protein